MGGKTYGAEASPDIRRFWEHMLQRHPKERGDGRPTAEATRWHELDEFDLKISLTLGAHMVRAFIRGEAEANPEPIRKKLEPFRSELEAKLHVPMRSEERGRFFIDRLDIDLGDENNWDAASDWLFERSDLRSRLREHLGG